MVCHRLPGRSCDPKPFDRHPIRAWTGRRKRANARYTVTPASLRRASPSPSRDISRYLVNVAHELGEVNGRLVKRDALVCGGGPDRTVLAASITVFEGTHPRQVQSPPISPASIRATSIPAEAAPNATVSPAAPAPTTTSWCLCAGDVMCSGQPLGQVVRFPKRGIAQFCECPLLRIDSSAVP